MPLLCACGLPLWFAGGCSGADADTDAGSAQPPVARVEIRPHLGRPMVHINGQPQPLPTYSPTSRPEVFAAQTRRFFPHQMGAYFLNVPRGQRADQQDDWNPSPFWDGDTIGPGYVRPLASPSLDEQAQLILQGDPGAWLIIRFGPGEPASWRKLHPDQLFVNELGAVQPTPSLASARYAQDSARLIETVIRYCESRPWAPRIIGYWTGQRVEGSHQPVIDGWVYDHSELMRGAWRDFLTQKYRTTDALRAAWGDAAVSLDDPAVPTDTLRRSLPEVAQTTYWQPAQQNQRYRDYVELTGRLYHQLTQAQLAAHHRATSRQRCFLIDALKQGMQGWNNRGFFDPSTSWPPAYHDINTLSGSSGAAALLQQPGLDGLITPHDYMARGLGGVYEPEGIADSVILRGRVFFSEMDTRSYTGAAWSQYFRARDDREFAALTWRNLAAGWTRGFYSYWMDVYTDWFASDAMHTLIGQQVRALKQSVAWPRQEVPGIAVIIDDQCQLETNGDGSYLNEAVIWQLRTGLARCGVPYRVYLLEDLQLENFPPHRVFYFPNLFRVDDQRLALLRQRVFRAGHVVLWGPGSGISDGRTLSPEHARALTGFAFNMLPVNMPRRMIVTDFDHPLTQALDEGEILGSPLSYGPVLFPTTGRALAQAWTKQGRRETGLAVLTVGAGAAQWHSVFTTVVPLPANLWRGLATLAGTHVYAHTNDVLMADRHLVALHSVRSGPKTILLPEPCAVHDVIADQPVGASLTAITFTLEAPQTVVFRLTPLDSPARSPDAAAAVHSPGDQ